MMVAHSNDIAPLNWADIEHEYVTGDDNVSYRLLGSKHHVTLRAIQKRGSAGNWVHKRKAYRDKVSTEARERTAEEKTGLFAGWADERLVALQKAAMDAIDKLSSAAPSGDTRDQAVAVGILIDKLRKNWTARVNSTATGMSRGARTPWPGSMSSRRSSMHSSPSLQLTKRTREAIDASPMARWLLLAIGDRRAEATGSPEARWEEFQFDYLKLLDSPEYDRGLCCCRTP